jgi:hypothetical protein
VAILSISFPSSTASSILLSNAGDTQNACTGSICSRHLKPILREMSLQPWIQSCWFPYTGMSALSGQIIESSSSLLALQICHSFTSFHGCIS